MLSLKLCARRLTARTRTSGRERLFMIRLLSHIRRTDVAEKPLLWNMVQ